MVLTGDEVAKHNSKDSLWVIIHGKVRYNVLSYLPS
jgi:cytochrome b involved in lipid metabolism